MEINFELLEKFINQQANAGETEAVKKWLAENNIGELELKKLIEMPEGVRLFENIDASKDWPKVREKLFAKEKLLPMRYVTRVAASVAILIGLSGLFIHFYKVANQPIIVANYSTGVLDVTLPDSSEVYLNTNSKIMYKKNFEKKRNIIMDGHVFFKVKRDVKSPFVINAGESNIKVLGTSFTIETKPHFVEVIVASGRVAFYSNKANCDTLILSKGDKGIFKQNSYCLQKIKNYNLNYLAWETHKLFFNNTSMVQVIQDLEKYYDIKITLTNSSISKLNYTSEFNNPSLKEVLKEMELVLNVKTERIGHNIKISPK